MPAVTRVIFLDDVHFPGEQVEAAEIVRVTVTRQPVSGGDPATRRTELYLTGKHADELDSGLDPWFEVGHRQGSAPSGGAKPSRKNWVGGSRQASVDYHREIREFLAERDIRSRVDPSRLAFETPSGKASYPDWAVELYDQWVAGGRPAPRKAG